MRQHGAGKYSPDKYDVKNPDQETGNRPNRRQPYDDGFFQEESECQQQVADVAHPEHVPEFVSLPVVHALGEEEDQRKQTQQAELCARGKIHDQVQEYQLIEKNSDTAFVSAWLCGKNHSHSIRKS